MIKKLSIVPVAVALLLSLSHVCSAQDWPNLHRYRKADSTLGPPPAGTKRVVFMGNSITDHWDNLDPGFFNDNPYIDRGISGQTTPQMLIRFRQDVIDLNPSVVVILAGTNDIAGNTGSSTLGMIENNLMSMCQLARANNIRVVLCALLPAYRYPWSPKVHPAKKIVKLNKWIQQYAHKNGYVFCNYYPPLVNQRGGMKSNFSKDGVHPNKAGYNIMEPMVVRAIHKALNK
ncbi:MAG TPA: SGNH/GDSL hydrolase family protein [Balneolaceae bacterium]|nr:SGNH/GDSL hydrolase family protein [Balneolaceae bacterium]